MKSNFTAAGLAVCLFTLTPTARAIQSPAHDRLPNFDKRGELAEMQSSPGAPLRSALAPASAAAVARLEASIAGVRADLNPLTQGPAWIYSRWGFLTASRTAGGNVISATDAQDVVKTFVQQNEDLFGFGPAALASARITREFVTPHNQLRTLVWQQQVAGLDVFEAVVIAHVTRSGELVNVASGFVSESTVASVTADPSHQQLLAAPAISAAAAVRQAAAEAGDQISDADLPASGNAVLGAEQRQVWKTDGLRGEVQTRLVWVPLAGGRVRLAWEVLFNGRTHDELFRSLVDGETGAVLLRRSLTTFISDATYRVFTSDSPSPFSPGHATPQSGQPPLTSRSLLTLSALDTNASPAGWINDGGNETRGNNVDAHTDRDNNNQPDLPRPQGTPFRVFDFPLDLNQNPTASASNAVVQLFYWCNWMHDRLYALGFTEAAGNFQVNNFGRGGLGNDAVAADAQDGGGTDNANMSTPPDGSAPRMQMYLFTGPTPDRDGDYDAEVILHEYVHGLSNRRVGGGVGISASQTAGMGEGWSDFYSLAMLSAPDDDPQGNYAAGGYLSYQLSPSYAQNYYFGIRRYPYTTDLAKNPLTFKDIDPLQASPHTGVPLSPLFQPWSASMAGEVHNQGEVWCVVLWEVRANLIAKYGYARGNELALQLVTDGMNLAPVNPNFVQARDAILQADRVNQGGVNFTELWTAFAKRGLGASATSPDSDTTLGVREAYDLPDDLSVTPLADFVARGPVGGPFTPPEKLFTLGNISGNPVVWTAENTAGWVELSATAGTIAPGVSGVPVTVTLNSTAFSFPAGIYNDTVAFSNEVSRAVQTRAVTLVVGAPDYLTELFDARDNDLAYQTFTFTPDGSPGFYAVCRQPATNFPTDPIGGTAVTLADDSFAQVILTGGAAVTLYTNRAGVFYIGSNGYLTLGQGDSNFSESLLSHFSRLRVAALFDDLNPGGGGAVSWRQLGDRVAVSYLNVPEYGTTGSSNRFQIELFFDGRIRITYLNLSSRDGLAGLSRGTGIPVGFEESDFVSYGACTPPWSVVLPPAATEGAGVLAGAGLVRLGQAVATNLVVTLVSSDPSEVAVPASVVLGAGQTNAAFDLTVLEDAELDGSQTVIVRASAHGYAMLNPYLTIHDNETNTLHVALPDLAREGDGPIIGTVSLRTAPAAAIVVGLISSEPTEILVPALVVIPAGQTSVVFQASVVNDAELDGPRSATVTARVQNWISGADAILVQDDEQATLNLTLPVSGLENRGTWTNAATIQLGGITLTNVVVSLNSSRPGQLSVPATVTVPIGQSNRTFSLTFINDTLANGDRDTQVSATATGFSPANGSLRIVDDDTPPVVLVPPVGQTVERGSTVVFTVTLAGGLPMDHQWWFSNAVTGAVPLAGAVQTNLAIFNTQFENAGDYWVVARNAFGTATSVRAPLSVLPGVTLEEALDTTNLIWSTSGNGTWRGQTNVSHDAVDAAVSGTILANQTSSVQTVVLGPGNLSFWWRVSSESGFDYLQYYRSGVLQASIAGEIAWTQRNYTLPAGTNVLRWVYAKDGSVDSGQDRGWLDQVSFTPTGPPVITTQPQSQTVNRGGNATLMVVATGLAPLRYQWRFGSTNLADATNSTLTLVNVQVGQAGVYSVRVTNAVGSVFSANAVLTVNQPPTAQPQQLTLPEDSELGLTLTGADPDGNALTFQVVASPVHGTLVGPPPNVVYRPATNYFGTDAFTFVATDGLATSAPALVELTVQPIADPPLAFAQALNLNEDETATITLLALDPDGDALTYFVRPPAHGVLTGVAPNLTYQAVTNYHGGDEFSFRVSDGQFTSAEVAVVITVAPVNDTPIARISVTPLAVFPLVTNQFIIAANGTNAAVGLDGSASTDAETDPLTYQWLAGTNELARVVTTTNALGVGAHMITLNVSDGQAVGTADSRFDVLTPAQSVAVIIVVVEDSSLPASVRHSLLVTLKAAADAFERGDRIPAINQLLATQRKVNAQVAPSDPGLATQLNAMIQTVVTSLGGK